MPCLILGISHFIPNTSDNYPAIAANIGLFSIIPLPTVITTTDILKAYYSYFLILFNLQNALQKNK